MQDTSITRGIMWLELRRPGGPVVLHRQAHNTVLRSGAELLAAVFAAQHTGGITGMAVGTSPDPVAAPYELNTLVTTDPSGAALLQGPTTVALAPDAFQIDTLTEERRVRVSVRAVLPPEAALGTVGEAALGVLAPGGSQLSHIYNRVVFEPLLKNDQHELALYWEISFPYGP